MGVSPLWLLCLACLRPSTTGQSVPIPPHILASLRNASTFAELESRLKLTGPSGTARTRAGGIGGVAPSVSRTRPGAFDTTTAPGVVVIDDPKQSSDSCKAVNICVPLPIPDHTGILLFPNCVDLAQCLGGCCESGNQCHPTQIQPVQVKYKKWRIIDTNAEGLFEFLEENMAEMVRHKSCGCGQCPDKPSCNVKQELVDCKCQCKNREDKTKCQGGNRRWSEEKCECKCLDASCPASTYLDPRTCSCQHVRAFGGVARDDSSSIGQDEYRKHVRRPGP